MSVEVVNGLKVWNVFRWSVFLVVFLVGSRSILIFDIVWMIFKILIYGMIRDFFFGFWRLFFYVGGLGFWDLCVDLGLELFDFVRERENEFYDFMDLEFDKVELFYKMKEE